MQRLFQPEDVVGRDRGGELDAAGDVVGRVHVQHEQHVGADRFADLRGCGRLRRAAIALRILSLTAR